MLLLTVLLACSTPPDWFDPEKSFEVLLDSTGALHGGLMLDGRNPDMCSDNRDALPEYPRSDAWRHQLEWTCAADGIVYVLEMPGQDGVPGGTGPSTDWSIRADFRAERIAVLVGDRPPRELSYDDITHHGEAWREVIAEYRSVIGEAK